VGLTWHNPNFLVLVEGPELTIQPVGIRHLPSEVAQVKAMAVTSDGHRRAHRTDAADR
jgi:hypothetical protein